MLQSYCLKQPSAKSGIKIHSRLAKHIHTPVLKTSPWPAHTTFPSSPSRTMLELSEWKELFMEIQGPKIAQKCYNTTRSVTPQPYVCRELSYNTTMWRLYRGGGNQPLLSASPVWTREDPCQEGKRTGWWRGKKEMTTQMHHSFKRRAKHAEVNLNSQREGKRTAPPPLPGCHSFPHLLSLKVEVKKPSPFPHIIQDKFYSSHCYFLLYQQGFRSKGIWS